MSLLSNPMGYLTNVSTVPEREPRGPADLVVASPSVSDSRPVAGTAFTLSATVRNDGGTPSPVAVLRYYESADATITTSDTEVGTDDVEALPAFGTSAESLEPTAPPAPGTYWYGACVDAVTGESDTTNNCSASVTVTVPAVRAPPQRRPDVAPLGVVLASGTLDGSPGRSLTLRSLGRNDGDAESPATELRYYRSRDRTITNSDNELGSFGVGPLAASGGTSRAFLLPLTAPSSAGTYFYGACVDAVAGESDTTNCSSALAITVDGTPPDLYVASLSSSNYSLDTGEEFWKLVLVFNQGDGGSAPTTVRYYRSADATITTSDTELGTDEIGALGFSAAGVLTLTAPTTPGTYYYGACVAPVPRESDTTTDTLPKLRRDNARGGVHAPGGG